MKLLSNTEKRSTDIKMAKTNHIQGFKSSIYVVINDYQLKSRMLFTSAPNKLRGQLLEISSKKFVFLQTFDLELSYIQVWFTDQNSKLLEIEDKMN